MEYIASIGLTETDVRWIIFGVLLLGFLTIMMPLFLVLAHRNFKSEVQTPNGKEIITSFFQIPYMNWYLIHWCIAVIALLVITALGIDGVLDKATIAALLGSLLGYTLGSTATHAAVSAQSQNKTATNDNTPRSSR